jgi:hypothetical protein
MLHAPGLFPAAVWGGFLVSCGELADLGLVHAHVMRNEMNKAEEMACQVV